MNVSQTSDCGKKDSKNKGENSSDFAKSELKSRENLYRLIISQLFYDGYQHLAVGLSSSVQASPPCPPSNRLLYLVKLGIQQELSNGTNAENEQKNENGIIILDN